MSWQMLPRRDVWRVLPFIAFLHQKARERKESSSAPKNPWPSWQKKVSLVNISDNLSDTPSPDQPPFQVKHLSHNGRTVGLKLGRV